MDSNTGGSRSYCKSCGKGPVHIFHELANVPVQSVLNISSRRRAYEFPVGNIALGFCSDCGFISNTAFDPRLVKYDTGYEATQAFSATFNAFARRQAEDLIRRYNLHGKHLVEIGCGNGEFLTLLCEMGDNRGVGFDPAYVEGRVKTDGRVRVNFVKDYFSEKHAGESPVDFIYCKMTLEHIVNVSEFIRTVRRFIGARKGTAVFFQVPSVKRILSDCAFEDVYYEHCSYFSAGSLARLFRRSDFEVLGLGTDYDDQYIMIDSRPSEGNPKGVAEGDDLALLKNLVQAFPEKYGRKIAWWQKRLEEVCLNKQRAVIWGAGSKGVAFLTALQIHDEIKYAVDINPYRQGTYLAGTGQEIISPDFLKDYRPDLVIIMNSVYKQEIERDLAEMGLSPEIIPL
jgi:2-polyprenyl-3-methyl-5-hydroxy-6-metoxy-1,4-benzoquinol methylase